MRTVYLGTSEFAAAVLARLAASEHRPVLVVTRPDRPAGRGRRLQTPPVAQAALDAGIAVYQPERVNDDEARERIAAAQPDLAIVCAFGALIREPLLSEREILNVHPSLLPRWRGAAPIERAIMAGDEVTGVAIIRLTAGLDSGPVCLLAHEPITPDDDFGALSGRLARVGGELLVQALDTRPPFEEQDEAGVTYAAKIEASDRLLAPLEQDAATLARTVRALHPHIGARLELTDGTLLGVHEAALARDAADLQAAPGTLWADGGRLLLACRQGVLELRTVQAPGGRAMAAADYLRGRGLPQR